ncbi:MAG: flagellum-specific ATP synthase FliI, partial [Gammaproteobacteria bacterium]|nr:flagellum-specific ATP synthase FliI [Gammaproteobacteria bacterium]
MESTCVRNGRGRARGVVGVTPGALRRALHNVARLPPPVVEGRLSRLVGLTLEARGLRAAIGERCLIRTACGVRHEAEVVGFNEERVLLMPLGHPAGLGPDARVSIFGRAGRMPVGPELLGRVVDAQGAPLDAGGAIHCETHGPLIAMPMNPLQRRPVEVALDVGVRAINALLTVARGQRIGLFAGSGVGKSVLLGMMARHTAADVIVVGLIGERGREVQEFTERI